MQRKARSRSDAPKSNAWSCASVSIFGTIDGIGIRTIITDTACTIGFTISGGTVSSAGGTVVTDIDGGSVATGRTSLRMIATR